MTLQSGFPIGVTQNDGTLLGNGQRPNVVPSASRETPGSLEDRLASADHPTAAWLNPAAFSVAPAGTWGDAPRVVTDVRTPKVLNADVSVSKQIAIGGGRTVEVKAEVFNLFNRVQTNGFASVAAGTTQFGRIASQIGFMRTTQFMIRMSW